MNSMNEPGTDYNQKYQEKLARESGGAVVAGMSAGSSHLATPAIHKTPVSPNTAKKISQIHVQVGHDGRAINAPRSPGIPRAARAAVPSVQSPTGTIHAPTYEGGPVTYGSSPRSPVSPMQQMEITKHREALAAFQQFDVDGNGFVTKEEAHRVLHIILGFTKVQTDQLVGDFDRNHDGKLSYQEFVAFYTKVKDQKAVIDQKFKEFDAHGKGYITITDARRILGRMAFNERDIRRIMAEYDTNKDGVLQYNEFLHFWSS